MKVELKNKLITAIKNPFGAFIVLVAVICIIGTLIWWGAPMKTTDTKDFNKVKAAIEKVDSGKVSDLNFGTLDEMKDSAGNIFNCQFAYYKIAKDSTITKSFKILKVKKGFLKYHFDGIYK